MLEKKYKNIVYFITLAIIATIAAQVYWNVKNYEINKQQVTNQIQTSFDNTVNQYYDDLAKGEIITLISQDTLIHEKSMLPKKIWLNKVNDSMTKTKNVKHYNIIDENGVFWNKEDLDSLHKNNQWKIGIGLNQQMLNKTNSDFKIDASHFQQISIIKEKMDSINVQNLTTKIMFSFKEDFINLEQIDSLFSLNLKKKNIDIKYGLKFDNNNPLVNDLKSKEYKLENFLINYKSSISNSSFLPHLSKLELRYTNTTSSILKRMLGSILLSLLLSGIIIGCLLFLLNIISKQKQLTEIKNDLISNITHEFKTPIATIGVALESIKNFNVIDDVEKTKNYLDISNNQLSKLNIMVEKLLETASLNSDNLNLQKEKINITDLLKTIIEKHQMQTTKKTLTFNKISNSIFANVDVFHFENAINNILDNAIKYGGNNISIKLHQQKNAINISISDDGSSLKNSEKEKIFEQFYRVPKGNTHDVKGFGIGLYYAKKIIEKHNGTIDLELKNNLTTFKISLPNE